MSNKRAKERLIQLYGAECFIEKLKLRKRELTNGRNMERYCRI